MSQNTHLDALRQAVHQAKEARLRALDHYLNTKGPSDAEDAALEAYKQAAFQSIDAERALNAALRGQA